MSASDSEDWECPLCMEEMDIDDRGFFPCECGYQICRFCHNRLSEDYGGVCPACRRLYKEQRPRWKPISQAQVAKIKSEKKAKERERREIESNNRRHLANVRVVQKNLVYVIGLPSNLATEEILRGQDYFGQFGRINKIVINRRQTNNAAASTNASANNHPTVGVYVTFATKEEATRAINAVDGSMLESRVLRATFGTTKYCSYYLRNIPCQNPNCMYLHEPGEEADSFTKEDLAANRAEMRDSHNTDDSHHSHHDGYDERHTHRGSSKSPGTHMLTGSGRSTAVPQVGAAGNSSSRLRKGSDINGGAGAGSSSRPRSVDPHNNFADNTRDGSGNLSGSALPATASWASKPMTKKPQATSSSSATTANATAGASDSKGRKSGGTGSGSSSGAMTLRMIPSTRNGKAAATAANNNTTKVLAGSNVRANSDEAQSSAQTPPVSDPAQHHPPVLQQLTRERKQQLRHQPRTQQKATATTATEVPVAEDDGEIAVETTSLPTNDQAENQETVNEAITGNNVATDNKAIAEEEKVEEAETKTKETAANSALSFQNIADSLFAQLNAKVSTPPDASSAPSFASATGGGSSGFAMSNGMDPLVFPAGASMSINSANAASSASAGSFGIFADVSDGSVHNQSSIDFMSAGSANQQQLPQHHHTWGYSQPQITPLSSLLTDSSSLNQSFSGGSSNGGVGMTRTTSSSSTRQRSRWDFVQQQSQADEASAQQELQSVLGRGGPFSGNSRDLGLFATPIQGDYNSNALLSSISGRSSTSMAATAAPFPPPGFGSRQQQMSASSPLGALPPSQLNVGAPPSAPLSAGLLSSGHNTTATAATSSALLSRLMGQQPSSPPGGLVDSTSSSSFYHPSLSPPQQQSLYQDPAILSTSMASGMPPPLPPPGTLPPSSGVGQMKGDANALNSLLAKLQLGGGGEGKSSTSENTTPLTGQDVCGNSSSSMFGLPSPSLINSSSSAAGMTSNGFVDPAIMQIGRNNSVPSAVGPPPGIMPTTTVASSSGDSRMVSRSANSSGRSRFLNHFSGGGLADSNDEMAATTIPKGSNGDPPGLPTTGMFGELIRKAKQDGAVTNGGGYQQQQQLQQHTAAANDAFSGGRMMLSDIEQKLEMARQEARQLQAQLSTVIGQNRSAMMALANNTSTSSSTAAGTSGGNGINSQ